MRQTSVGSAAWPRRARTQAARLLGCAALAAVLLAALGAAQATPAVTFTPSVLDLGLQSVSMMPSNGPTAGLRGELTNTGTSDLVVTGFDLINQTGGEAGWRVEWVPDPPGVPMTLGPGQSQFFLIFATPGNPPGLKTADLRLFSNAPGSPELFPLRLMATAQPLVGTTEPMGFGRVPVGSSAVKTAELFPLGQGDVIDSYQISGLSAGDFPVTSASCPLGLLGPPSGGPTFCGVFVRFTPTGGGVRTAQLKVIAHLGPTAFTTIFPLTGTGLASGLPTNAVMYIGDPTNHQSEITVSVGECVVLGLLVNYRTGGLIDVTSDPNTTFVTDPPRGSFPQKNVWCPRAADANHALTIYGRNFVPSTGLTVTATVVVHIRRNDGKN